jgi:very-short-patch-repair endonuclease|tara:strand:- start:561 stop:914 length:354 start_codon:yes stop_codon:yes gene_type:complete
VLPRDYTKQELVIAEVLSDLGLRYDTQVHVSKYVADFFVPELGMIIEADGIYGHLKKRDIKRDADLMRIYGIKNILHIKDNSKTGVTDTLWQALNKLEEELQLQSLENDEQLNPQAQ